jgi:hypothetical protein
VGWTKILLGVLLVVVGIRQWRGRHEQHGPPKWMSAIDRMASGRPWDLVSRSRRSTRRIC